MYPIIQSGLGAGGSHEASSLDIRPDHRPLSSLRKWTNGANAALETLERGGNQRTCLYELRSATLFFVRTGHINHTAGAHARQGLIRCTKPRMGFSFPWTPSCAEVNHIYESDIIQLSVYRVILSHKYKAPVAKYGYVRTVVETADGDRVRYIKTNLLSEKRSGQAVAPLSIHPFWSGKNLLFLWRKVSHVKVLD